MQNDDKTLKKWCKEEKVDYQLASKLKAKIFPLIEEAHRKLQYHFDKAFTEQRKGTEIRHANSKQILLLLQKLRSQYFSVKERAIISLHLEYMTLVEGLFATEVNFLVFTLIANGHDLYPKKEKHIRTLGEIEKENFAFKLDFLKRHRFGKLIIGKVDRKLRNSIAHLFYELDDNGTIKLGNRKITPKNYRELYDNMRNVSFGMHLVTKLYYRRFADVKQ